MEGFFRSHGFFEGAPTDDGPPQNPYLETDPAGLEELHRPLTERKVESAMTNIFTQFVDHHIFRYQGEFGFSESLQSMYILGRDRPKFIVYTEKVGMWDLCKKINKTTEHGRSITVMASHGEASYQKVEQLGEQLKGLGVAEIVVGAMCDYDPYGLWIAWNFDHKLSQMVDIYGPKDAHGQLKRHFKVTTYMLTTGDLFTPAQVKKHGKDLTPIKDTKLVAAWLKFTHGIHSKPIAIHVDVVGEDQCRQRMDNWMDDMIDHIPCPYPVIPKIPPSAIKYGTLPIDGFDAFTTGWYERMRTRHDT
jgi:hypothetical protein